MQLLQFNYCSLLAAIFWIRHLLQNNLLKLYLKMKEWLKLLLWESIHT